MITWLSPTTPANSKLAAMPAAVPSALTAPSVPRGTGVNGGVDMYVVMPYALPTSLAVVSLNLLQKLATNPEGSAAAAAAAVCQKKTHPSLRVF